MLLESSSMNMTFGLMDVVPVPRGSVAMLSCCGCARPRTPKTPKTVTAMRVSFNFAFMVDSSPSVEDGLYVTQGVARPGDPHRDAVVSGTNARQCGRTIRTGPLGASCGR